RAHRSPTEDPAARLGDEPRPAGRGHLELRADQLPRRGEPDDPEVRHRAERGHQVLRLARLFPRPEADGCFRGRDTPTSFRSSTPVNVRGQGAGLGLPGPMAYAWN